jgi:Xaa-Pro aminopeptidase
MLQPGASPKEIFAEHNAFMQKHGMHKEPRLHCHGQGYDVVERPMIRHDEDMPLDTCMNIGLHPTFGNARLFVTVCDNFLIGPDGKIEHLHKTPRKIFEL